jgi:drug/metabolite transporter (DMT)-like permease
VRHDDTARGVAYGIAAGVCFGVTAPLAKRLGADVAPLPLAGLLYLGAGLGLSPVAARRRRDHAEPPLRRADAVTLTAMILLGGLVGPWLLLVGLRHVSGVAGSLLLNLEAPLTIVVAVTLFGDHVAGRALAGSALILAGAVALSASTGAVRADVLGVVAIAGACLAWAFDNNLAQRLVLRDPVAVARWKTLGAGVIGGAASFLLGYRVPADGVVLAALAVGFVGYGVSIALAVAALRHLGAARQAALFAIAPFAGAVAAVPVLGETIGAREAGVAVLMVLGVALLLRDDHGHVHTHEPLAHEHLHVHDAHHAHAHAADVAEPHSHFHVHEPETHTHPHAPDAHHRHRH